MAATTAAGAAFYEPTGNAAVYEAIFPSYLAAERLALDADRAARKK